MYFFNYSSNDREVAFWFSICLMPVTLITTYTVSGYLIPKYLILKKYGLFALYVLYTVIISSYAIMLSIFGCFIILSEVEIARMPPLSRNFWFVLALVFLVVGAVSAVRIMELGYRNLNKAQAMEKDFLKRRLYFKDQELNYLKKQIHPHFLFNTLNTIYSMAVRQSKDTPEVILKLSELLDYLLYQANKPTVALSKELDHIRSYIELERIRFSDSLRLTTDFESADSELLIPPMLLIPLVENAFKHGQQQEGELKLTITCSYKDDVLLFTVLNSARREQKKESGGLGLDNLRKRLNLLFPDRHELTAGMDGGSFKAQLQIVNPQKIDNEKI